MDLGSATQDTSQEFADVALHDDRDPSERKSSHAFRTISEVSDEIDVPQHVLRFWESKFGQIRPLKRGGGRRYYRPEDIELLKRIKNYLYKQGYTIKGVQRLLKEKRHEAVASFVPYAKPDASLPNFPFEQALQAVAPLSIGSYLQAASAAPSALAMAYGSIGGQIAERAIEKMGTHHFGDAFEQSTVRIEAEKNTATDQMEKSLFVVTQLHEEISANIQPIRIINPAAPSLDDMAEAVVEEAAAVVSAKPLEFELVPPVVEGLPMLSLPEIVQPVMTAAAPQPAMEVSIEVFEEEEFNQDVADEEIPVKRLDEAATFEEMAAPAPAISPEKREQLLGVLAEMMALRDMLNVSIVA